MIGKITLCDTCKKSSQDPKEDAWIAVATKGIMKYDKDLAVMAAECIPKPLDFCSWRCFRKHWKGK